MEKTVTIKEGDLLKAYFKVSDTDEPTKELFNKIPMLRMAIALIMAKVEKTLLEEEESK